MIEQFCECQMKCTEDTEDTWTCTAHLAEGHVFQCRRKKSDICTRRHKDIEESWCTIEGCPDFEPPKPIPKPKPKRMIITGILSLFIFLLGQQAFAMTLQEAFNKRREGFVKSFGLEAERLFNDPRVKLYPEIIKPPPSPPDEESYYKKILKPESVQRGKQVLIDHADLLQQVEDKYRVNKEGIVGIYRIETNCGNYLGKYEVFNSLLTWMIGGKAARAKWAENELKAYLKICDRYNLDPLNVCGSTHGAFGLLQFIPSSFLLFAVDGNDDGVIDLFDTADAFHSTGNYLSKFGWDMKNEARRRKALFAYNHDRVYVNVIMKYVQAIRERW